MKKYLIIGLLFTANFGFGQSIKSFVDSCYSFNPHELTSEEINVKSGLLDIFWDKIESNKDYYLPLLRNELKADGHKAFFYYDCGSLLLKNSQSNSDYEIVYNATKKVDLRDVQGADFIYKVIMFAQRGFDTYDFAEKIFETKDFKSYLVKHALTLNKDYSLLYVLLPISNSLYVDKLVARLDTEKDLDNQMAIITILGYSCTCKADSAIDKYALRKDIDKNVKDKIEAFQKLKHKKQNDGKYNELIEKRNKEILTRLSDEALYELDDITKDIKKNYICR
jgi:hypothetical protein